ncbi:uncharacterized protein LOC128089203 [Tympanuchus pallidicinctus]|uniref:uncharacterized protein LOC128089203 n=1 Tax=Tympanuchus pallidicinctus TaxID=109042 RepID=UPI0022875600|nr:uncharacterized protein LOC128089203 [Tympanuchus pallidicinctus]
MLSEVPLTAAAPSHTVASVKPDSCALYSRRCPARVAHHDFGPSRSAAANADTAASAAEKVRVQAGPGAAPAASPFKPGEKLPPRTRERRAQLKAVNVVAVIPGRLSCPAAVLPLAVQCQADGRPRASYRGDRAPGPRLAPRLASPRLAPPRCAAHAAAAAPRSRWQSRRPPAVTYLRLFTRGATRLQGGCVSRPARRRCALVSRLQAGQRAQSLYPMEIMNSESEFRIQILDSSHQYSLQTHAITQPRSNWFLLRKDHLAG